MKILRHLTPQGPAYAAVHADGSAEALSGSLWEGLRPTGQKVQPTQVLSPLDPCNILGIGLNYRRHAEEGGKGVPTRPLVFLKSTNAVQSPGAPILLPRTCRSDKVDYEGELAVIIGRPCRNATRENALSYVFGYTVANDVSARDWQFEWGAGQFCQGKSFDSFCPLGPVITTADEIPDPHTLALSTRVNGELRQDWRTDDMVFDIPTLIAFLSGDKTLLPGTVILTGTPHGVGYARTPPTWLQPGDSVSVTIEAIGTLTNPVQTA